MASPAEAEKLVLFETRGKVAIITLNAEKKLNALTQHCYFRIGSLLHEIANRDDIVFTVLTGKGRYFSAGADVTISRSPPEAANYPRAYWNGSFVANNFHNTHAFYTHPKILISALNGPAVGLSAALTAHSDFIYAAPHAFFLTPFTSLGLVAEGGASKAVVDRMGLSLANEALLMSRKIGAQELKANGYVNKIIEAGGGDKATGKGIDSDKFLEAVLKDIEDTLGDHLNHTAMLGVKKLIRQPGMTAMDAAGVNELQGGLQAFLAGRPQQEFAKIASGAKRHKL